MENPHDSFILEPVSENTELPTRSQTPVFTGSGGEYFRIWIVNVALTVLTLGIYAAWAKVRTRRYFYANTVLDGQPFDYLARPGAIFRGYMIVGGALLVMNLLNNFLPRFGTVFSAAALSCVPYLLFNKPPDHEEATVARFIDEKDDIGHAIVKEWFASRGREMPRWNEVLDLPFELTEFEATAEAIGGEVPAPVPA